MPTTECSFSAAHAATSRGQSADVSRRTGIELFGSLAGDEAERLDAIRSRAYKLKTLLAMVGYAPEFAGENGDVLWLVREQIDVIEALAAPPVIMFEGCVGTSDAIGGMASEIQTPSAQVLS